MSYLTDFLGGGKTRNWIKLESRAPVSISTVTVGPANIAMATIRMSGAVQGFEPISICQPETGAVNHGSDVSSGNNIGLITPRLHDTLIADYSVYINTSYTCTLLNGSNLVTSISGFKFLFAADGAIYLAASSGGDRLTSLSLGLGAVTGSGGNGGFFCASGDAPNLADVNLKVYGLNPSSFTFFFTLIGCKLTQKSVENILVAYDSCPYNAGTMNNVRIDLSGGTSSGASQLTAAASAARTSLLAKGVGAITLNP